MNEAALEKELRALLQDEDYRERIAADYAALWHKLKGSGTNASGLAAAEVISVAQA
jgi:hypothetical protein